MEEKLLSMLGIARRAGRLIMGYDAAAEAMQKGECRLLVLANDLSERTKRNIISIAESTLTDTAYADYGMDVIGKAIGRKQTGIIAISDSGFAGSIKALCRENSQEECI